MYIALLKIAKIPTKYVVFSLERTIQGQQVNGGNLRTQILYEATTEKMTCFVYIWIIYDFNKKSECYLNK